MLINMKNKLLILIKEKRQNIINLLWKIYNKIIKSLNDNKNYLKHCYFSKELIKFNDIEFNINEYTIKPIINYDKKIII